MKPSGLESEAVRDLIRRHFPHFMDFPIQIGEHQPGALTLTLAVTEAMLRPGGTLSGPTLMALADTAMYVLLLSELGDVESAVTASLHIDFLRRPAQKPVIAKAELLKVGRALAVGRVVMLSEGDPRPIAHASITYALPARTP